MKRFTEDVRRIFTERGNEQYAEEAVTQLQHALQCATLAQEEGADDTMIVAAFLHDIGHILEVKGALPGGCDQNLHDLHEEKAYQWLKDHLGEAVAQPVKLHVAAKRYLCTKKEHYRNKLSKTSLKSFYDQGGDMSEEEITAFEAHKYYHQALHLRYWDDVGKTANATTPPLEHFLQKVDGLVQQPELQE